MPSIKFYLKHAKRNGIQRKTEVGIVAKINVNGHRFEIPTGEKIRPQDWNPNTQKPRAGYRAGLELNHALQDFAELFRGLWRKNRTATTAELRQSFAKLIQREQKKTVSTAFTAFLDQMRDIRDTKTWQKYRTVRDRLEHFRSELDFSDMDLTFFDAFKAHLYSIPNPNYPGQVLEDKGDYFDIIEGNKGLPVPLFDDSVSKYIEPLKVFLRWAQDRGYEVPDTFKKLKASKFTHKPITLTIAELEKLESAPLTGKVAIARDYLVFECRTGQRISDVKRFNLKDFDGQSWTFYPRKGNRLGKKKVTVHFTGYCAKALEILERYNFKMPALSEQKINNNIKEACKAAGIDSPIEVFRTAQNKRIRIAGPKYEFISSHVGRKTFITIALQFMSPTSVMQLAGIDSYSTLKHYEGSMDDSILREHLKQVEHGIMKKAI